MNSGDKTIIEEVVEDKEPVVDSKIINTEEDLVKIVPRGRPKGTTKPDAKKQRLQREAAVKLWKRGVLHWKLDSNQKSLYENYHTTKNNLLVWCLSRQTGKSINSSTYVITETGPKLIKDINIGDIIYGYNKDGSVSPTKVVDKIDCGVEEVFDLVGNGKVLAGCTDEHYWLVKNGEGNLLEKPLKDFNEYDKIVTVVNGVTDSVSVRKENRRMEQCWDITVDNDTHLYLTGDGLVTHNSFLISLLAIEECIRNPNFKIAYVLPRQNQARKLIKSRFNEICIDCPKELRPKFNTQENVFVFDNGSEIHCIGTDSGNIENARGQRFDRVFMDECGFMDSSEFDYYYKSVLFPTMNTSKRRLTIMISTPPSSAAHTFNKYIKEADYKKAYTRRTIYDCPRFKGYEIEEMANAVGGKDSIDFKREYLCKLLADTNSLVIPEATDEKMKDIIQTWKRPAHYTCYTSGDFGILDWTAFLFAYYDFRNDEIVVEDELVFNGKEYTTIDMADAIKLKEKMLWGDKLPESRICDTSWQIIVDFNNLHNLSFIPTRKDDKNAQINALRMKVSGKKLKINPRCINLIFHLMNATWNKARTKYEKAADGSHFDCLDALIYLIRNINYHKNPYPKDYDLPKGGFYSPKQKQQLTDVQQSIRDIFTVKRRR